MHLDACSIAPESWKRLSIKDVCQRVTSGGTPSRKNPEFYLGGSIGWVKTKELHDGFIKQTEELITPLAVASSSAKILPKDTILLAMYGATVGMLGVLGKEMACNQACCAMLVKPEFDRDFLFYQLLAHRTQLQGLATGAAQQNLSGQQIKELVLPFPSLDEQRVIGSYLRVLDDRITLLRETNATLEAIAQTLFKSWFVDFDPVRTKMEGRVPEGMDEATAALFPDSFEATELGAVPKGWLVGKVADLGEVICGKTPPTSNPENYGNAVPFITIPDMHGLLVITETARSLSRAGADSQKKKYLPPGAICASCIATPGLVVKVTTESQTNQQINSVVPFDCWGKSFPLFLLRRIGDAVRAGGSGGSVFHNLSKSGFEALKVLFTSSDLAGRFNEFIDPLVLQLEENQHQAKTLSTLRNTLLPCLISGQLKIHF
ncbi:MAG: hypothetical protein RLZ81_529 [Pseudomonadota bacterium]|jgi:type I restriction enzyme S subunit